MSEHDAILVDIRDTLVTHFDHAFPPEAIAVDVDVFDDAALLVPDRAFDSMDLVETIGVLEERFDLSLAPLLTGDEPLTLAAVARHIAESKGGGRD